MATPTSNKSPCSTCGKVSGLFTCRGCQKDFCTRHVVEHRQELGKQMDELTLDHDRFRQNLTEQTKNRQQHPLMKQITEWEQDSIQKIYRVANDARKQLQSKINENETKLTERLTEIATELRKAREDDDFFETDLKQWMDKLDQLKKDLNNPPTIKIQQESNTVIPFIPKITETVSSRETFERSIGNVRIEDGGHIIIKILGNNFATVRGSGEYSCGQHRIRLRIEEYHTSRWIFLGMVSKSITLVTDSRHSESSYGWAGSNQAYLSGNLQTGYNGYKTDIEKNDIVELFIDCDQTLIQLKNERTGSVNKLQVDIHKCSFPWQFNIILYYLNDRVRILPN